jgi:DHA2 family multidrug resistance protein
MLSTVDYFTLLGWGFMGLILIGLAGKTAIRRQGGPAGWWRALIAEAVAQNQ